MSDTFDPSTSDDMLPAERRDRIIEWFVAHQVASTQDLAKWLGASISTIRRDLDFLASQGVVRRTHGGAVRIRRNTTFEPLACEARSIAVEEKRAIAAVAAGLLLPGQSVMLDTRTTLHHAAYAIAELTIPLTIVTNDVHMAGVLANKAHIKLLVPGGICRDGAYVLLGESGIRMVQELRCDHLFLSSQAVDLECVSDTSLELVQFQKAMVESANETTLLLDSSRFGSRAIYRTVPIERLRRIVTDEGLPGEERERYASVVPELLIAPFLEAPADDR